MISFIFTPNQSSKIHYVIAVMYFATLLIMSLFFGVFSNSLGDVDLTARLRNAAIGMPLFTIYIYLAGLSMHLKLKDIILELTNQKQRPFNLNSRQLIDELTKKTRRHLLFSCFLGIFCMLFYVWFEGLFRFASDAAMLYLIISAIPFWISCCYLILLLSLNTKFILKHIVNVVEIDYQRLKSLLPVSDQFISYIIVVAVTFALSPIFWISKDVPILDIIILSLVFLLLCVIFFKPIIRIQQTIAAQKKGAITDVNIAINALLSRQEYMYHLMVYDCDKVRAVCTLLNQKREISESREWAISNSQRIRGALFVVFIPITWTITYFIESGISSLSS